MIILRNFHTYKDDFPLLSQERPSSSFDRNTLHNLMTGLIFELSDLAILPAFAYITRHENDKVPTEHLAPFINKFHEFVDYSGNDQTYSIPTVWFVGYFKDHDSVAEIRRKLDQKNIKYFVEGGEYDSFYQINPTYWEKKGDAEPFVKFIHQTTMIGIGLLSTADYKQKLKQLKRLEYIQYINTKDMKSDLKEMERYLRENSSYYRKQIVANTTEFKEFWENFTKWKRTEMSITSWPHFLFNICGVPQFFRHRPLKITKEKFFKDWW